MLVRQNLPLINPYWLFQITFLPFMWVAITSRRILILHNLPAKWPVVPHILLLDLLKFFLLFYLFFPIIWDLRLSPRSFADVREWSHNDISPLPQGIWTHLVPQTIVCPLCLHGPCWSSPIRGDTLLPRTHKEILTSMLFVWLTPQNTVWSGLMLFHQKD